MTNTEKRVLTMLRIMNAGIGTLITHPQVETAIRRWDTASYQEAPQAMQQLNIDGYITLDERGITLLEKGYNHIYRGYAIEDTERQILLHCKYLNDNGYVLPESLRHYREKMERFHQDHYHIALRRLVENGLLEGRQNKYKITRRGKNLILRLAAA